MKQNNRQTSPFGRSTEEKQAGLSLLHPQLFLVVGDTYKYYNEIVENVSDFLSRLTSKKFMKNVDFVCLGHLSSKKTHFSFYIWSIENLLSRKYTFSV